MVRFCVLLGEDLLWVIFSCYFFSFACVFPPVFYLLHCFQQIYSLVVTLLWGKKRFMGFVITFPHLKMFFSFTLVSYVCVASVMLLDSDLQIKGSILSNVKNFTLIFLQSLGRVLGFAKEESWVVQDLNYLNSAKT